MAHWLLEPYQLVSQNKLEPLLKASVAEATPNTFTVHANAASELTRTSPRTTTV